MDKLDNAASKYDNTKLKAFLTLSCMVCIGVPIFWLIAYKVLYFGDMVYPLLMIVHMFLLKDDQRNRLFQWKHSQVLIYVFFGLWALFDVFLTLRFIGMLSGNLFTIIIPGGAQLFFQWIGCLSGFFLFQRNRLEAQGQTPLPQEGNGPLLIN